MGCSSSIAFTGPAQEHKVKEKRSTFTSITSLDNLDTLSAGAFGQSIKKRHGHPTYFRGDGYDLGLRVRVKGVYNSTYVGCARNNGEKVSIKEHTLKSYPAAKDSHNGEDAESVVANEASILVRLAKHESIPRLREIFTTDAAVFLVTDYVDPMRASMFLDLKANTCSLPADDVRRIMRSLCSAVAHCHERGVVVRDLSPNNIMVRKQSPSPPSSSAAGWDVVIADFALAVPEGSLQVLSEHPLFDWAIVPYTAPEALLGHPYSCAMDNWALGVLAYTLLSGHQPFHHDDDHVLVQNIRTASFDFDEDAFDTVEENTKSVISHALKSVPQHRWNAKEMLLSAWLSNKA